MAYSVLACWGSTILGQVPPFFWLRLPHAKVFDLFTRHCLSVASSSYTTALFTVPLDVARSVVPDDYFTVAEILPGEAIFFVGTGEFRKADLGPYKEMYVGFYTENRQGAARPTREDNFEEFTKNESKMYMWKNWVTTPAAVEKMDEVGSTLFRRGEIDRHDFEHQTRFAMRHESEGSIQLVVPRENDHVQSTFSMSRTHYGRLHGEPSRVQLDLNIDEMVTSPGQGELTMDGPIANECAPLGVPKQPLVSIWIEEMNFKMGKPLRLERGA